MSQEVKKKLEEYQDFLENTLKVDLKEIEGKLNATANELEKWIKLKNFTSKILPSYRDNVKFDLNVYNRIVEMEECEMFVRATVEDFNKVYIDIGCNCLLQMDLEEATKYASIRIRVIEKKIVHYSELAVKVKVNIKVVLLAIQQLDPLLNLKLK
ncbi:PREDICTED: protein UXT homolog [Nicrophorus vespilloides]|uniref:Protein UXT homolog n=1 Tax=Nicrophorus vespilloides TaxID=110193 RepID=A0ABM1M5Y2_NICVS|nr:PREDICTED: protein UXT homolog [Nicrophorus vespilloides]